MLNELSILDEVFMKKFIKSSTNTNTVSALDLADDFYGSSRDLENYLDSLPVGTCITDIVVAPGSPYAGHDAICEKQGGYKTAYYNPWGVPPSDAKYQTTWWSLSGAETNKFNIAKIILEGTEYYCTRDVFEDDDF